MTKRLCGEGPLLWTLEVPHIIGVHEGFGSEAGESGLNEKENQKYHSCIVDEKILRFTFTGESKSRH